MKKLLRIFAYLLLTLGVIGFGYAFIKHLPKSRELPSVDEPTNTTVSTNTVAVGTNAAPAGTNPAAVGTNTAGMGTNAASAVATNKAKPPVASAQRANHWGTYFGCFLLAAICLGLLASYDIAHYFVHRAGKLVFDEDLVVENDPEYEEAEKIWANGKFLEAIQLMRDFLAKNPHAQYAALRIAEIYEKNLGNYLAAALEYEEILTKKLHSERWGWAAIHLANLYSGKLNKVPQAEAWLHRIIDEYPKTGAAKKARERLGIPQPVEEPEPEVVASEPEPEPEETPPPPPQSNLPRGFRPKS